VVGTDLTHWRVLQRQRAYGGGRPGLPRSRNSTGLPPNGSSVGLDALLFAMADFNAAGVRLAIMHLEEIATEKETLDCPAQERCDDPVPDTSGLLQKAP
jgi:hypothetical protein